MCNNLDFQLEMAKSNTYTLKILQEDKAVYLHSKYNPSREAENWAQSFYEPGKLFIMIGNGLGYYSKALVAQMGDEDKLLIVEPSKRISQIAVENIDSNTITDERVVFSFAEERENLQRICIELVNQQLFSNTKIFISPNYDKFFAVDKIVEQLKTEIITYGCGIATKKQFAKNWQENYFKAIRFAVNSCPITKFEKEFKVPAIIVAAGPSLTPELEKLKMLSNKALIICAGSAAPILLKNNITPHFIVAIDGGAANYQHFANIDYNNIPLFYSPTIHHQILEDHKGAKVIFQWSANESVDWYNELIGFETGIVKVGPSVANLALDIACKMTSGPICFVGQDLGYTGGTSHAQGNSHRIDLVDLKRMKNVQVKIVEANDGSELYSDYSFILMKEWFENYLTSYPRAQVYNATLRGAKINGTIAIELGKFVETYCQEEMNIKKAIDDILVAWDKAKTVIETNNMRENMLVCLSELIQLTNKSANLATKLLNKVKNEDYRDINKILNKLSAFDEKIMELKEKDGLLYFIIQPLMDQMDTWNEEDDDASKKAQRIAEKNYFFYTQLKKMSREVRKMVFDSSF